MNAVTYQIAVFEKDGDSLVSLLDLSNDDAKRILTLLGFGENNVLYDGYPLEGATLEQAFVLLGTRLTRGNYSYFVEAVAGDGGGTTPTAGSAR